MFFYVEKGSLLISDERRGVVNRFFFYKLLFLDMYLCIFYFKNEFKYLVVYVYFSFNLIFYGKYLNL